MEVAGVLSAAAATAAAMLAGLNLIVSGRRDTRRWAREVLIDTFTAFLDGAYRLDSACRDLLRYSSDEESEYEAFRDRCRSVAREARTAQLHQLTRLRLISTPDTVRAAEGVRNAERDLIAAAFQGDQVDSIEVEAVREDLGAAVNQLIRAARGVIDLRGSTGHLDRARP